MKPYLKTVVKGPGRARAGLGVELFRLDAVAEDELTAEETDAAEEGGADAANTAVMRIYEDIGEDFWSGGGMTAKKFADELDSLGDVKRLNIHINSLGGDVFAAQAIHSIICGHASKKTAYIDGVCASAATLVACGADEVIARHNTNYMLHYPWAMAVGNADTMRKAAADLDAVTIPIVSVYREQVKGKIDEEKIRGLMEDETWLTADEAFEYGFVDKVRGKIKAIARVGSGQIMCSGRLMDTSRYRYRNVPKYPLIKRPAPENGDELEPQADAQTRPQPNKEKKHMNTREEIAPELLATIEGEARAAERTRLAALDAMNGPGLGDIIAKAKADGKQPNDIALECLTVTKQQLGASQATSALARDAAAARGLPAGDAPPPRDAEKPEAKGAKLVVSAFKSQKPRGLANAASANGRRN